MRRPVAATTVLLLTLAGAAVGQEKPIAEGSVGMPGRVEALVLPGTELEAAPLTERKAPVVLRVVQVYPHGTSFRYDLEWTGLEAGVFDLRPYLKRKNGSPLGDLPPLFVKVDRVLPAGQVEPHALTIDRTRGIGGYGILAVVAAVLWGLGLLAILASFFLPRRRRRHAATEAPATLADRLKPLIEGAVAGTLSQAQLAGLERGLLAYWRKRLNLETVEPGEALQTLRKHPEAGPLLDRLEGWLHRPGPPEPVDTVELLAPYRFLAPDAVDLLDGPGRPGGGR